MVIIMTRNEHYPLHNIYIKEAKDRGKELAKNIFTHPDGEYRIERIIGTIISTILSLKIIRNPNRCGFVG